MQTTTLEVTEVSEEVDNEDGIVHICCEYCDPLRAFCGADLVGHSWVANCKPADECVVCADLEKTSPHICKDGFNWGTGDYENVD